MVPIWARSILTSHKVLAWVIAVLHLSERIFFVSRFLVTRSMPKYYSCAIALTEHESENEFNIPKTT